MCDDRDKQNYDLIRLFFEEKGLVSQHISSFNYFIETDIRHIMEANSIVDSDIDHTFYLKYLDIRIGKPTVTENMVEMPVYPQECRNRDLTYAADIYVDVEYVRNKQIVIKRDLFMGKMPIMLRSTHCHLAMPGSGLIAGQASKMKRAVAADECFIDNGGYFIIKGIERVVMIQEQLSKNRIILETGAKGLFASVTSSSIEHKGKTILIMKNDCFYIQNSIFTEDVPAVIVARALEAGSDQNISEIVSSELFSVLAPSFEDAASNGIFKTEQALLYLSKYVRMSPDADKISEVRALLAEKMLPNIPVDVSLRNKGVYVCLMMRRLAQAKTGVIKADDKDFLGNKRFELAGQLLSILFEDTFKKFNFELKRSIDKILSKRARTSEFDALTFFNLQTSTVTTSLNRSISSGNWNLKRFRMERSGVTSVVTRYSYICALGMMTKINSHFEKTRKVSGPRALHTSSWGMFCPADTPEGESCGLVKNLALLAEVTTDSDPRAVEEALTEYGVRRIEHCYGRDFYRDGSNLVFLNGGIYGVTSQPEILVKLLRERRRKGQLNCYVSVSQNKTERSIGISTDNGRMCRPLIIVDQARVKAFFEKKGHESACKESALRDNFTGQRDFERDEALLRWLGIHFTADNLRYRSFSDLIKAGLVEYLDVQEENDCRLAFRPAEITLETTHLEISEFAVLGYVAGLVPFPHHNQSPRNTYQCAMGKQAIGHIATNVKKRFDSMILQLNYTQRPMAASKTLDIVKYNRIPSGLNAMVAVVSYSGYDIEDALILNRASVDRGMARVEVYRTNAVPLRRHASGASEMLVPTAGFDGVISPGSKVSDGTVLVSKTNPATNGLATVKHRGLPALIDKVMLTKSDSETVIKIVTRETRVPEIGDKFSSRHGQKGVVGLIVPQTDMPFNEHGLCPDIIMNPHGFPSRMTVGKMLELVSGKAALLKGTYADATPFRSNDVEKVCKVLTDNGYSFSGKDVFTSGTSGEPLEAYVFYGPVFYQRLKHMVADKMHCRARGPRAILTRQPTEGRSRDGGLRLGEMERDCLIGYGASALINERLMLSSDAFEAAVCQDCGIICYKACCTLCKKKNPAMVRLPYACKLLFQELMSMNILAKIELK